MTLDNIELDNLQAGDDVATDLVNTDHYQYVKITYGAAGTVNEVTSTATNPFPVALSDTDNAVLDSIDSAVNGTLTVGSHAVTNAGTFAVQISDPSFAVADGNALGEGVLIQGDDGTDRKNINVDATTGDVQVDVTNTVTVDGSGVTQPVSNAGTFATQVDGDALTALQLIDDAVHADDAAFTLGTDKGMMMMGFAGTQSVNANDAAALACDVDGALHISDGGNTITVDGTVTANLSATDNAVLDNIQTAVELIDNAIAGSEMQVDVVAALPAGDNNIGNVDIASAIPAGTNTIGRIEQNVSVNATGTTTYYDGDLDETKVAVDAGAVNIYSIQAFNTTDAPLFLQLFNVASGSVTVGTTTPTNQYVIPGNADSDGAGFTITFGVPKSYDTALTIACTTDNGGSGAPGANACLINIEYAT